jgi:phosphatidylglycerol:prolipoprotein diacylglycerol transferase
MLLSGLVGAKLLLVIVDWPHYVSSWSGAKELVRSAGVFYGGLIGAVLATVWVLKRHHIGFFPFADAAAPSVALGQAIGRLGCFSAGCCWGAPTQVPWAITFTNPLAERNVGTPLGIPLHPTQLYEALGTLLLCVVLVAFERRSFSGETFARYLVGSGTLRFVIEIYRGDPRGSLFHGALSTSQAIALVAVAAGLVLWVIRRRVPVTAAA